MTIFEKTDTFMVVICLFLAGMTYLLQTYGNIYKFQTTGWETKRKLHNPVLFIDLLVVIPSIQWVEFLFEGEEDCLQVHGNQ